MITGIVMASGLSRRMGENKLLLDYMGSPIFAHTLKAIKSSMLDELVVVTHYSKIISYCTANNIKYIFNPAPEVGQSQSIRLGVAAANKEHNLMFFVADQPLLKAEVINRIIEEATAYPEMIIVPKYKNTPGNPKIFPYKLRNKFLGIAEDVRGSRIILEYPQLVQYITIEDSLSFFDIDTPEDYKNLNK